MKKNFTLKDAMEVLPALGGFLIQLLLYIGVNVSDLWGLAAQLRPLLPLIFSICGFILGYSVHHLLVKRRTYSRSSNSTSDQDEFIGVFCSLPYEYKAFIKATLEKGATYYWADDQAWEMYDELTKHFILRSTIRNGIIKCRPQSKSIKTFLDSPLLLADVDDQDVEKHAVCGPEGTVPQMITPNRLCWWYYTDSEVDRAPCSTLDLIASNNRQ